MEGNAITAVDGTTTAPVSDGQYLSFSLGGEDYGLDILRVQEIRGWETVRALPDTPEFIKGVLDMRGTIHRPHRGSSPPL